MGISGLEKKGIGVKTLPVVSNKQPNANWLNLKKYVRGVPGWPSH